MKSIFFIILSIFITYGIYSQSLELNSPDKLLDLTGTWKFNTTDNEEYSHVEMNDSHWENISIPGLWRRQNFGNTRTGWYRNQIYIHDFWQTKSISILSPSFTDAHEFYFNGIKIGGEGKISSSGECLVNNSKSKIYSIPESAIKFNSQNTISIRVCNYVGLAGVFGKFQIGETDKIEREFYSSMVWNVSIGLVFLFVSFYHLLLFVGSKKDLSYLYFSLSCLFSSTLTLGYYRFTYWVFDSYKFHFYFFNSGFGIVGLFLVLFLYSFFEYKIPNWIKFINYSVMILFFTFILSPLSSLILQVYTKFSQPLLILSGIPYGFALCKIVFQANQENKNGSKTIAFGLMILLSAFFMGILFYFNLINVFNLLPESFLIFVLCIAVALSAKFYRVSEELLAMGKKHNEELEKKIQDRTKDLEEAKKTAEIETGIAWIAQRESQEEKEKTEKLLKELQKDMLTAQRIQQNILPKNLDTIKNLKFGTLYKPFSSVGGDFYDVEEIKPGVVRAFIADATGHGVQAALITMAIKSEYESVKDHLNSPAKILKFLNENFSNKYKSLNIYFTAFIIDIDTVCGKITFASAGHIPQLLISSLGIEILSQRGNIIGMIPDAEYEEIEKEFNSGRLYLFTDGIEEEFNPEQEQFGEERIITILEKLQNEPIQKTLDILYFEMKQFIGNMRIRDDITLIGIDYKN